MREQFLLLYVSAIFQIWPDLRDIKGIEITKENILFLNAKKEAQLPKSHRKKYIRFTPGHPDKLLRQDRNILSKEKDKSESLR